MFFDEEINNRWCLNGLITSNCTRFEAFGIWSVLAFYTTIFVVTIIHAAMQQQKIQQYRSRHIIQEEENYNAMPIGLQRSTSYDDEDDDYYHNNLTANDNDDLMMLCLLLIYFFGFVAGCLLWVLPGCGIDCVHPISIWQIQILGSTMLIVCLFLFIIIHINLGSSWSPVVESNNDNNNHKLVTHGIYKYVRHPMYAIFLWGGIATLMATLNWVITWCVFGSVVIMLRRIKLEERILIGIYGDQYLDYRRNVSALGFPWKCLGYDKHMMIIRISSSSSSPSTSSTSQQQQQQQRQQQGYDAIVEHRTIT